MVGEGMGTLGGNEYILTRGELCLAPKPFPNHPLDLIAAIGFGNLTLAAYYAQHSYITTGQ
jgi:hypothetical protein